MIICDANILLRYILDDIPDQVEKAAEIIENNEIFLPFEVIAEIVYVLLKVYKVDRKKLCVMLSDILQCSNISTVDQNIAIYALNVFAESQFDFVDTLLCGYAHIQDLKVATFDRKLSKRLNIIESELSNTKE